MPQVVIIEGVRQLLFPVLIASLMLGACKKDIQNGEAVRRGIVTYLSKRQDLGSLDVTITKVSFRKDEADATAHIQPKNSDAPNAGADFNYVLERKGDEWVVKGRANGSGHGAGGGMANPHGGGVPPGGMPLPPGHPQVPPGPSK